MRKLNKTELHRLKNRGKKAEDKTRNGNGRPQESALGFFNNGHLLPGAFSSDCFEYKRSKMNKYCAVVVHIATFFLKKSNAE